MGADGATTQQKLNSSSERLVHKNYSSKQISLTFNLCILLILQQVQNNNRLKIETSNKKQTQISNNLISRYLNFKTSNIELKPLTFVSLSLKYLTTLFNLH